MPSNLFKTFRRKSTARLKQAGKLITRLRFSAFPAILLRYDTNLILGKLIGKFHMREYDLPLHKSEDARFLVFLVGLMSFLAVLAFTGSFTLNTMTERWSSGLENKITIEILPETKEGLLRPSDAVRQDTIKIVELLENKAIVKNFEVLGEQEIRELISPWIGDDLTLSDIPLPGLIAVELQHARVEDTKQLEKEIEDISRSASLNTHHDWLKDLIRLTSSLQLVALIIAMIIGITTITAISGGIRTRMAIHKEEVQLLHLIGATDYYIARQLQRHAMILALRGAIMGTAAGFILSLIVMFLSRQSGTALIPEITLGAGHYVFLMLLPLAISIIAAITARYTVLHKLALMP